MGRFNKILILIFTVILSVCGALLIACNNEEQDTEVGDYGQIIEEIDNTKISYTLNDFEKLSSLYKCRIGWGFGKISSNEDKAYIKSGEKSAKVEVCQEGGKTTKATLNMPFLVDNSDFDITKLKNINLDIYNNSSDKKVFQMSLTIGTYTTERVEFELVSGWNHVEYEPNLVDAEKHVSLTKGKRISFYFDRPNEIGFDTYYLDNVVVNNRNFENFESVKNIDKNVYSVLSGNGEVVINETVAYKDSKSLEFKNNGDVKTEFNINFNQDQIDVIKKGGAIRFYFNVLKGENCTAENCTLNIYVNNSTEATSSFEFDLLNPDWAYVNLTKNVENCTSIRLSVSLESREGDSEYSLFIDNLAIVEKVEYKVAYYKETDVLNEYNKTETVSEYGYVGDNTVSSIKQYNGYISQPVTEQVIKSNGTVVEVKYYNTTLGVPYYINHYLAFTDNEGDGYILDKNYSVLRGMAGETTNAVARDYYGYSPKNFEQDVIKQDGSTVIEIYYSRDMLVESFETFELEQDLVGEVYDEDLRIKYFINGEEVTLFNATTGLTKPSASIVSDSHSGSKSLMYSNDSSSYLAWFRINLNDVQKQALKDGKIISFWYKIESTTGQSETFTTTINSVNYYNVYANTTGDWTQVYLYNDYLAEYISFYFSGSRGLSGFNIYFDDVELIDAPEISYKVNHVLVENDKESVLTTETKSGLIGNRTQATILSSVQFNGEKIIKVNGIYYAMRYIEQQTITNNGEIVVNVYYDLIEGTPYKVVHKLAKTSDEFDGYYTDDTLTYWYGGELGEDTTVSALSIAGYTAKSYEQKVIRRNAGTTVEIYYERDMLVDGVELYDLSQAINDYVDTSVFIRKYKIDGEFIPYYVQTGMQKPTVAVSNVSHTGNKSVSYSSSNATSQMWIMFELNEEQMKIIDQDGQLSFWYKAVTTKKDARKTLRTDIRGFTMGGGVYDFVSATNNSEWKEYVLTKAMINNILDSDTNIISWHIQDCDGTIIYVDDITVTPDARPSYKIRHYLQDNDGEYSVLYKEQIRHGNVGDLTSANPLNIAGFNAESFEQLIISDDNSVIININYTKDLLIETFEEMPIGSIELSGSSDVSCEIVEQSHKKYLKVVGSDGSVLSLSLNEEQQEAVMNMSNLIITYTFSTDTAERYAIYGIYVNGALKLDRKAAYSLNSGYDKDLFTIELSYDDFNNVFDKVELRFEFIDVNYTSKNDKFIFKVDDIEVVENKNSYYVVNHYLENEQGEFVDLYKVQRLTTVEGQTTTLAKSLDIDGYYALDFEQIDLIDGQIVEININYKKSPTYTVKFFTLGNDNEYSVLVAEKTLSVKKPGDLTDIDSSNIVVEINGIDFVYTSKDFENVVINEENQVVNINCNLLKTVDGFEYITTNDISDKVRFAKLEGGNIYYEAGSKFGQAEVVSSFSQNGNKSVRYYIYDSETVTVKATMSSSQLATLSEYDAVKLSFAWKKYSNTTSTAVSTVTAFIGSSSGTEIGVYSDMEQSAWIAIEIKGADKVQEFINAGGIIALKADVTGYKYAYVFVDDFTVEIDQTEKIPYTVKHVIEGDEEPFATDILFGKIGYNTNAVSKGNYIKNIDGVTYSYIPKTFSQVEIGENTEVTIYYELSGTVSVYDFESDGLVYDAYIEHTSFKETGYLTKDGENTAYSGAYLKELGIATDEVHSGSQSLKIKNDYTANGWGKLQIDLNEEQKAAIKEGVVISFWCKFVTTTAGTNIKTSFTFMVNGVEQDKLWAISSDLGDESTEATSWHEVSVVVDKTMLDSYSDKLVILIKDPVAASGKTFVRSYNLWVDDITISSEK